jgi:ElaB/YqjD/DUF883 family membrane-anchored ribosome-binding protein
MAIDREGQVGGQAGFGSTPGAREPGGSDADRGHTPGQSFDPVTRSSFSDSARVDPSTGFGDSSDDLGTRAGSYDRKFTEESPSTEAESDQGKVRHAVNTGKNRIADQLQRAGERIEERARDMDDSGGMQRRAGQIAHRASGALDSGAHYLRDHEVDEMRDDLEHAIRARPLLSVGIAAGAGFLLARILRD